MLFAAMANAAGFEARYARMADRSQYFFHKDYANLYFMQAWQIAVRVDNKWMFFDPASTYVPFGMLRWQEEGTSTLVTDNKDPEMAQTAMSPPDKSVRRRLARFDLSEDGTLEGEVRIEHSGHRVVERRREYSALKQEERIDNLKKEIEDQFPGAEVTKLELGNLSDTELPLVWNFHIKIPGYAQRTGKRLFLQPAVFERGYPARFTAAERKFPIYFHYPWMDVDHVTIRIPEGYELDIADMPPNLPIKDVGHYNISAQFSKATRELTFQRELVFGKSLLFLYPVEAYPALKQIFEIVHTNDNHTISVKQGTEQP